jgi:hypothetical protein
LVAIFKAGTLAIVVVAMYSQDLSAILKEALQNDALSERDWKLQTLNCEAALLSRLQNNREPAGNHKTASNTIFATSI